MKSPSATQSIVEVSNRHILGISGKDSATAAIWVKLHHPEIWDKAELFFNDTRCDYPCVHEWLDKVETFLGKPITRIDGNLPGAIARRTATDKAFLPSRKVRYCTSEAKIIPMERWIGKDPAILYTGLRFDEQDRAGYTPSAQVSVRHPLIEGKLSLGGVYAILDAVQLLPPDFFWQSLYDAVVELWQRRSPLLASINFDDYLDIHHRRILFSGRTRTNCYFCFNQRLYEFVWLSEAYPELFEQACSYEKDDYTWKQDESLRDLVKPARKAKIIGDRALYVCKQIEAIVFGKKVESEADLYDSPSCGLLCGK